MFNEVLRLTEVMTLSTCSVGSREGPEIHKGIFSNVMSTNRRNRCSYMYSKGIFTHHTITISGIIAQPLRRLL